MGICINVFYIGLGGICINVLYIGLGGDMY